MWILVTKYTFTSSLLIPLSIYIFLKFKILSMYNRAGRNEDILNLQSDCQNIETMDSKEVVKFSRNLML